MADLFPQIEEEMRDLRERLEVERVVSLRYDAWRERRPWRWFKGGPVSVFLLGRFFKLTLSEKAVRREMRRA